MNLSSLLAGDIGDIMKEELLPENVPLFGNLFGEHLMVNPSFRTAFFLTLVVLAFGLIFRFIIFPRFKKVPGTFQALLEKACEMVEGIAKDNSPHSYTFIATFSFGCWVYIGLGTLCEILGIRAILVDLNACIALAVTSYSIMLFGGIKFNKLRGAGSVLKDISRKYDRRTFDYRARVSLHRPFHRRSRNRRRTVHPVPCGDSVLCLYAPDRNVLRRSDGTEGIGRVCFEN